MKKVFLIILIATISLFAQSAGNSGLSFLKMGFGARNIAMGDAGAALSHDVTSLFYNPANLANTSSQIMIMHNDWIQGVKSELLGAETDIWGLPIALGFDVTTVGDIPVRTIASEQPITTFNANYFSGSISTGFNLRDDLSFGLSAKYLYEGLFSDEAEGWGFDFGLNYRAPIEGLSAVAVINNLGSMNKLKNEKTKLPTEFSVGPAYTFELPQNKLEITAAAELQKYTATNDNHFNYGIEITYDKLIALRGGYQSGYISKGLTAGLGLMWGGLEFDYALTPFSYGLGNANSISLSLTF
jgi:hypothetical protein